MNIFVTKIKELKVPIVKTIDINRKFVKCALVNKAKTPHWELKSKVAPLKKYPEKAIKIHVKKLFKNNDKNGG